MAKTFRDALLTIIEKQGVSLRKVAEGSGVSYEQLKKLKQAKSQSTNVDDARKVANFFGLSLDQFLEAEQIEAQAEIIEIYNRLPDQERQFLLRSARGLADREDSSRD
ncbi:MAG: helix-turn-helix domain-containing protein [Rhodobacteraceae bacterium]|nr:helix-turn-helix domain-containing protein [Paracoccaceae bacterium]